MTRLRIGWWSLFGLALGACSASGGPDEDVPGEGSDGANPAFVDDDYGKSLFDPAPPPSKADTLGGRKGLPVSVDQSSTAVWEVKNQWEDTASAAARKAGMAWSADSGLNWDEKYAAWVGSLKKIDGHNTYYKTFELTTPYGKTLPSPSLECAEMTIFLRVAFSAWYNLPFFMEAVDGANGRLYFGHFGARTANGRYGNMPNYKTAYKDYSYMTASQYAGDGWPKDSKLRSRGIGGTASDDQPFLGDGARAGTYFDEIFLNKRAGHFLRILLSYFGSVNVADSNNTFNLKPAATLPGDTLLERWQRRGIGHTLVVIRSEKVGESKIEAQLVSGSMPRRQAKWEDGASSKRSFTDVRTGGEGENSDGEEYAKLGGGIKRWRTAKNVGGRWTNVVMPAYTSDFIPNYDTATIAQRPAQFEALLGELDPADEKAALLAIIEDRRNHLKQYPSSCSARIAREDAFTELYELNQTHFGKSVEDTDREHRTLSDYVFAELVYDKSKTCCWNGSTAAMYDIVMEYNEANAYNADTMTCNGPTVFKNTDGGYNVFKDYAASIGRSAEWNEWSEDESCSQRDVLNDTEEVHEWKPFCDVYDSVLNVSGGGTPPPGGCGDMYEGNSSQSSAASIPEGTYSLETCDGGEDWFAVDVTSGDLVRVRIDFTHADGDLDLFVNNSMGGAINQSEGTGDSEEVNVIAPETGQIYIRVAGYDGASNSYSMNVSVN